MLENIALGIVTGVTAWLPVSSDGIVVLLKNYFFDPANLEAIISLAWFLKLGPAIAATIYFRKEIKIIFSTLFKYRSSTEENKKILGFLVATTIISGFIAIMIRGAASQIDGEFISSNLVNIIISVMLFVMGLLYLRSQKKNDGKFVFRGTADIKEKDRFILGVAQGFSIVPGLSRTGLTAGLLILQRYSIDTALRLSIIMSIPMALGANLVANVGYFDVTLFGILGLICSGVFGYLMLYLIFKHKDKINYGHFVIAFGFLILISNFIR